jgi:low affinity Fe/Cu permease
MHQAFRRFAVAIAELVGSSQAFLISVGVLIIWALTGPFFHYSDTWQLVINTGTSVITFLMVFLIQNTQNREAKVLQLKLDELLRGVEGARTGMVRLEDLSDEDIVQLQVEFEQLRKNQIERHEIKLNEINAQ